MTSCRKPISCAASLIAFGFAFFAAVSATAHPAIGTGSGFSHGLQHPITGLDHICAMFAVGLWAVQRGGRAVWLVPLAFVLAMAFGGALGMAGVAMPFVEQGIVASLLVMGVLIAAAVRLPMIASMLIVGLFALVHGHAHGTEAPATIAGFAYVVGFVLTTATLHLAGMAFGLLAQCHRSTQALRWAGAVIALAGIFLFIA